MDLILKLLEVIAPYGLYSYALMFAILIACGFGFPMPEDVVLITGGILASQGITTLTWVNVVCMAGVLIGDGIVFTIGYRFGPAVENRKWYQRMMTEKRREKVHRWFERYGDRVIFFARFAPGLRMPLFMTSGIFRVSPWKFLALDGFAALISVPVWIWVGYFFGSNMELLAEKMKQLQIGIYGILGGLLVAMVAYWYIKKRFFSQTT